MLKQVLKQWAPGLSRVARRMQAAALRSSPYFAWKKIATYARLSVGSGYPSERNLEIGPGVGRIEGFETLDIVASPYADYLLDATGKLPFKDNTFSIIYASHILEHVPWHQIDRVLAEWVRILRPGGHLEIWVPDGLKICKAFVDAEFEGTDDFKQDGWFKFNEEQDPCVWVSGRLFTYGDGTPNINHQNWHRAMFSPRYLLKVLQKAGLKDCALLERSMVRGYDHGWINLGATGTK